MEEVPYLIIGLALVFGVLAFIWHEKPVRRPEKRTRLTALYYRNGDFAGWFDLTKLK